MSSNVTLNGVQYVVPAFNDTGWAQGAGNLSLYLAAIASSTLQPTGGAFTLTSELDFGANFGVKQLYLKTETANPASAGVVRLASADTIKWRNNANGADIALSKDASDNLQYNATKVLLSGAVVNADINAAAAIAYSKLALTGSILNADINASAAIAYSKLALTGAILNADLAGSIAYSKLVLTGAILNADLAGSIAYSKLTLTGSIVNADIGTSAAIALSKLAALGTGKALQSNASTGFIEASSVTNTELGFVSGVTSAIQTQIAAKASWTAWASYTPTYAGLGTVSNSQMFWRQVGDTIEVQGSVLAGTVAASTFSMTLPSGKTIDYTKVPAAVANLLAVGNILGYQTGNMQTNNAIFWAFVDGSDTGKIFAAINATGGSGLTKVNGNGMVASAQYVAFKFSYPIAG